ncbi:CarD family transcriptional regulator, partial [Thermogutta sp.]|uniref:CarD family transcriptional regulator n=1 Tax=Thermogutta sp. TaxID=1962930 RepID=UPI003C7A40B3
MESVQPDTEAIATNLGFLVDLIRARDDFARLLALLRFGHGALADEAAGSGSALLAASLAGACSGVVLVVVPDEQFADTLLEDLRLFGVDEVALFPALTSPFEKPRAEDETLGERLRILLRLIRSQFPRVIVASGESLLQTVPPVRVLEERLWTLRIGDHLDVAAFLKAIGDHGYRSVPTVAMPGEFSLRGGILDVFAPEWTAPLRIELFDERVESLRHFDVSSQRSVERVEEITLILCAPTEQPAGSFFDYLPPESWTVWIDPQGIEASSRSYLARLEKRQFHHAWEKIVQDSRRFARLEIWDIAPENQSEVFHGQMESVERFSGDVERVREELDAVAGDFTAYLVCTASAEVERLRELFAGTRIARSGNLHFVVGRLSRGFRLRSDKIVVLSVNQLFQRTELRIPARRPESRPIEDFLDLKEGDLVVHVAHGIARYRGLT